MGQYGTVIANEEDRHAANVIESSRWSQRPLRSYPLSTTLLERRWLVRASEVDLAGILRLDSVARYLCDLGVEHLDWVPDGEQHPFWSVAHTTIEIQVPIKFGERVHLFHWPEAVSHRSFRARAHIRGDAGGLIEAEQFLVRTDARHDQVARMSDDFISGTAATASADRLRPKPAVQAVSRASVVTSSFPLRRSDFDAFGLVGHGLAWHGVVDAMAHHPDLGRRRPHRATVQCYGPVRLGDVVSVARWFSESGLHQQLFADGTVKAIAHVTNSD